MPLLHKNRDRWFFVVNATAGQGKTGKKINQLILALNKYNFDYEIEITKYAGHGIELAGRAVKAGFEKIIAVGGDGTANEVMNGILNQDKSGKIVLGIIPEGGGNDFARVFHLSSDITKSILRLKQHKIINIDVGKVEKYYFLNSLGMGFDAVAVKYASEMKRVNGLLRYLLAIFKAMVKYKNYDIELEVNGETKKLNFTIFSVGNGQYCGGGIKLTPLAKVDDGLLDVGIVTGLTRRRLLKILPQALQGKHLHHPEVEMLKTKYLKVRSEYDIPLYLDGDIPKLEDPQNIEVEILKDRLRFFI